MDVGPVLPLDQVLDVAGLLAGTEVSVGISVGFHGVHRGGASRRCGTRQQISETGRSVKQTGSEACGFPTSLPSYPAVHDSLHRLKLVFLQLRHVFTQNLHQVVRVGLQLLVLLVADVDGGLPPGTGGRHLALTLVLRGRALRGFFLLAAALLPVAEIHPEREQGAVRSSLRSPGESPHQPNLVYRSVKAGLVALIDVLMECEEQESEHTPPEQLQLHSCL